MKKFTTLSLLALCGTALGGIATVPTSLTGQDGSTPQETPVAPKKEESKEAPKKEADGKRLHESMERLEKGMRALRRLMTEPEDKDKALAHCSDMEEEILLSLQFVPAPHSELTDQTELEYRVEFKRRMVAVYTTILDLELALEAGDAEAARAAYRELGPARRDGHQIYIPEEEQRRNRAGRRGRGGPGGRDGGGEGRGRRGDEGGGEDDKN